MPIIIIINHTFFQSARGKECKKKLRIPAALEDALNHIFLAYAF